MPNAYLLLFINRVFWKGFAMLCQLQMTNKPYKILHKTAECIRNGQMLFISKKFKLLLSTFDGYFE